MAEIKTVELRTAYAFDCDQCGRENFVRAVVHELSEDEKHEMAVEHGEFGQQQGQWVTIPPVVKCCFCGACFSTADFRD